MVDAATRFTCHVREIVTRSHRPTLVITDVATKDLPMRIQVGDPIALRRQDKSTRQTYIAGIEINTPFDTRDPFAFIVPRDVDDTTLNVGDAIDFLKPERTDPPTS